MDIITYGIIALVALVVILVTFLVILWIGFRMGRHTIGQPLPPITKSGSKTLIEEDPWYKPMTGEDQPSYPTGADR